MPPNSHQPSHRTKSDSDWVPKHVGSGWQITHTLCKRKQIHKFTLTHFLHSSRIARRASGLRSDSLYGMSERFINLNCVNCGGKLDVYDDMERFTCGYCRTEIVVQRRGGT